MELLGFPISVELIPYEETDLRGSEFSWTVGPGGSRKPKHWGLHYMIVDRDRDVYLKVQVKGKPEEILEAIRAQDNNTA